MKEALSKALKTGMMTPFTLFAIKGLTRENDYWKSEFFNFGQYQALSFLVNKHICSIVYPKNTKLAVNIPTFQI